MTEQQTVERLMGRLGFKDHERGAAHVHYAISGRTARDVITAAYRAGRESVSGEPANTFQHLPGRYKVLLIDWRRLDELRLIEVQNGDPNAVQHAVEAGLYETVEVEARDVDEVFQILNGPERPNARTQRSMSVGDVVIAPNGSRVICSIVGWDPYPSEE